MPGTLVRTGTDAPSQYGFPLSAYGQFVRKTGGRENTLHHSRALADSDFRAVVRPNVDTLYSYMFYDVSHHDLNITVPELDDRLWLFSFYDMYVLVTREG